jgi:carbon-monoxide dehydrogenase large subunit
MGQYGIGQPVRRKEDVRLLTGKGRFTDDIHAAGELYAYFLRSPHAHATIRGIDSTAARSAPGVAAIFTGADLAADGLGNLQCDAEFEDRAGGKMYKPLRRVIATDRARFVGEIVGFVLADSLEHAKDAADLVELDYEELPAITATAKALDKKSPVLWPERGSNLAVHWEYGDGPAIEAALAGAAHRVAIDIVNNRVIPSPMEPRAALATYDKAAGKLTLTCPSQGGRRIQNTIAKIIKIEPQQMRVVSYDTGGGFGIRSKVYPELVAICWAARKIGRPIKWRGDRSETFVSDYHGRDQVNHGEMGLDEDGHVVALKVATILNVGAYLSENGPRLPINGGGRIIPCAYHIPKFYFSVKPVFTNTVPTDTYRGAGRPEANFLMERLMDFAAEECGLSRDEIRRRNLIRPEQLPYRTHLGFTIDSGDFTGTMEMAMKAAHWSDFAARRAESAARGRYRGIGLASFIEGAGGRPTEEMRVRLEKDGSATVIAGTYSHGQGHETVYAQLVEAFLGIPFDKVTLVQGDSDLAPKGSSGTFGSRSSMMGGDAIKRAAAILVEKAKPVAARLLQSEPEKVSFSDGAFRAGHGSVTMAEVAKRSEQPLDESYFYERGADDQNFPNGCHICEIEVDVDLGQIEMLNYVAVDDCGVVLNPFIVHGQVFGGVAQGIGQALTENVIYEEESGQLLTGTYMDYGMPRAHHLSPIAALFNVIPCKTNDLGVKGAGEAGACGAPAALVSALCDALKVFGIRHIDMPLTAEKIWRAVAEARARAA